MRSARTDAGNSVTSAERESACGGADARRDEARTKQRNGNNHNRPRGGGEGGGGGGGKGEEEEGEGEEEERNKLLLQQQLPLRSTTANKMIVRGPRCCLSRRSTLRSRFSAQPRQGIGPPTADSANQSRGGGKRTGLRVRRDGQWVRQAKAKTQWNPNFTGGRRC